MREEQKYLMQTPPLFRFKEHMVYNQQLHAMTLFPYNNVHKQVKYTRLVLNFSFKELDFNKKKVLPFFLAMELLTSQKCVATLSSKNILVWKLRKGMLVGCKVTLRKKNLEDFFDSLFLALPRMEKFKKLSKGQIEKMKKSFFSLFIYELLFFYPIELALGINTEVRKVEIKFLFNSLSMEEKVFLFMERKIPINF